MKKKNKLSVFVVVSSIVGIVLFFNYIVIVLSFNYVLFFNYVVNSSYQIKIETEYGDQFIVFGDDFGDLYTIDDVNSSFGTDLYDFINKKQINAICDNQYIRCYRISDGREDGYKDKFIFKIKKYDEFFSVRYGDVKYSSEYMFKDDAEKVKSEFLCDALLMKICLVDLDYLYHDELVEMGEKFVNRDFEGLDKYGLTEEMINDTESLNKKITIMEDYLKGCRYFTV